MGTARALRVWHAAVALAADIVDVVRGFDKKDPSGTGRQMARAAGSVSANIAEGAGRGTRREQLHYYRLARGSLEETRNHLRVSWKTGLLPLPKFRPLASRAALIGRMLSSLIAHLERLDEDGP